MTDYIDRIKAKLPKGYDRLLSRSKPRGPDQWSEEEWQSVCDIHADYINDLKGIPYADLSRRQKEFVKMGVEAFAEMNESRRNKDAGI